MKAPEQILAAWAKRAKADAEARAKKKATALLEGIGKAGPKPPPLERALRALKPALVAELRRKDASGDWLDRELDLTEAAAAAKSGDARALFVATDPQVHAAVDGDIARARSAGLPIVLHQVTVTRHQLAEARVAGASAVTLHAALLPAKELTTLMKGCIELGMQAVVLVSDAAHLDLVLDTGAPIACVERCDDDGKSVDSTRDAWIEALAKAGTLVLVRGAVDSADEVKRLAAAGADALVVGPAFVRAADRAALLKSLAT